MEGKDEKLNKEEEQQKADNFQRLKQKLGESSSWLQQRCHKIQQHWETYPYVWSSYIVVFGGLGAYTAYRWIKLRRMENQLLQVQREIQDIIQAQEAREAATTAASTAKEECKNTMP